jgi:hypothetical protein
LACAVSRTCQTTTAPISIGLPSRSFTLIFSLATLCALSETLWRSVKGLVQYRPLSRTVPR